MTKSERFPHLYTSPYQKQNDIDALVKFNGNYSTIRYFRNNRISGQFVMCENLP